MLVYMLTYCKEKPCGAKRKPSAHLIDCCLWDDELDYHYQYLTTVTSIIIIDDGDDNDDDD